MQTRSLHRNTNFSHKILRLGMIRMVQILLETGSISQLIPFLGNPFRINRIVDGMKVFIRSLITEDCIFSTGDFFYSHLSFRFPNTREHKTHIRTQFILFLHFGIIMLNTDMLHFRGKKIFLSHVISQFLPRSTIIQLVICTCQPNVNHLFRGQHLFFKF